VPCAVGIRGEFRRIIERRAAGGRRHATEKKKILYSLLLVCYFLSLSECNVAAVIGVKDS
jgi:hypothetical protein